MTGLELILTDLTALQFSDTSRAIIIDQLPIGYGGQLSRRLLGLKIGLALGRTTLFRSKDDPPYVQSMELFHNENDAVDGIDIPPLTLTNGPTDCPTIRFDYFRFEALLVSKALTIKGWVEETITTKYALAPRDLDMLDGLLLSWIRFLPAFESRLDLDIMRLGIDRNTLGVHLRRGDKQVESPYVPATVVNAEIARIRAIWPFQRVFVASDHPEADRLITVPPGVDLIFDRTEPRHNNANHKMLLAQPQLAAEETYIAFKNLRLLAACGGLVGQDNAHLATMAASSILYHTSRNERVCLLSGNIASAASPLLGLYYRSKFRFRQFVRALLPESVLQLIKRAGY